jgi:hypothetical protein
MTFTGLTPLESLFVEVEALCECLERVVYSIEHDTTLAEAERLELRDFRLRIGLLATFSQTRGWPDAWQSSCDSTRVNLLKLGAVVGALEPHIGPALACIEATGPDYRPRLADYLRKLRAGFGRVRARLAVPEAES